uniref:Uncharacterized protein n=1 Tax=Chenopodium quinoa TaxID=63459 RepID=A0A803KQD9_CHEQI
MKKWVGSKVLLLLIIAIVTTMVDTSAAARNEFSEQPEGKQLLLKISNILLQGARGGVSDDNNLSCWPQGTGCNPFDASKHCCDGYVCNAPPGLCEWCPRKGDPCGLNDPCCPRLGLTCDALPPPPPLMAASQPPSPPFQACLWGFFAMATIPVPAHHGHHPSPLLPASNCSGKRGHINPHIAATFTTIATNSHITATLTTATTTPS